jgi:four helix bundle protein
VILDHERLDVYRLALDFMVFAHQVIEALPRGRSRLCDQLTRASTSIVLNLAEGAGKHSKADKRRYYLSARGSATESAALLDVLSRLGLLEELNTDHRGRDRSHPDKPGKVFREPAAAPGSRTGTGTGTRTTDPEIRDRP